MWRRGAIALLLAAAVTSTAAADEVKVFTNAVAQPKPKNVDAGSFLATADTCVYVDLNGQPLAANNYTNATQDCTIAFQDAAGGVVLTAQGKGEKKLDKYPNNLPMTFFSRGIKTDNKNAIAVARAQFTTLAPVVVGGKRTFPATLRAYGRVEAQDPTKPITAGGLAAAQVNDPYVFTFENSGSFEYDLFLGEDTIELDPDTGEALSNLSFFSNADLGRNYFELGVSLSGVMVNKQSLNGELFSLLIDSRGQIDTADDLFVRFLPSSALGLSDSVIGAVNSYIKSQLHLLSDGSVGLDPGVRFALFGSGSPLSTLTFEYLPGTVVYEDRLLAGAEVAPEPSTVMLLATGLLGMIGYRVLGRRV